MGKYVVPTNMNIKRVDVSKPVRMTRFRDGSGVRRHGGSRGVTIDEE